MSERRHFLDRGACPFLPNVEEVLTAETTRKFGQEYDAEFYRAALRYAQSLWLEGKAAQALLQLNKAFLADLKGDEDVLLECPLPYAAKRWVIEHCPPGEFIGNPVRHYQHLATRMSGPRAELRRWRAWACFHLAEALLPGEENPRDERQIANEGIVVPAREVVVGELKELGLPGEGELVRKEINRRSS
ncbi:MAG: hypothetical protein OSB65_11665 [Roseibacillus sp.]|nr:hypothetical protein [Roseibacillus sp.]